jgi:acyl-coenzyme A thioesterase PaaI-like protein
MSGLLNKLPTKLPKSKRAKKLPAKITDGLNPQADAPNSTLKPISNQFTKLLSITKYLPAGARSTILSKAFGKVVPYVGTTGVYYETVEPNQVVVSLNNNKAVQNHIGSIHAVAVTLLAETATGFILGLNLPSDRILLVKSYSVNFYRPLKKGQVAAVATLSDEQRLDILNTPKGEMVIPCIINDRESDSERDPITVEMTWAWIPKSELEARRHGKENDTAATQPASNNQPNHEQIITEDNRKPDSKTKPDSDPKAENENENGTGTKIK